MNNKKSMKRKRNNKTRNTRKNIKKGGVNPPIKSIARKAVASVASKMFSSILNPPKMPVKKNMIDPNYTGSNRDLFDNSMKDLYNQVLQKTVKEGIDIKSNQPTKPSVDVKKTLETPKSLPTKLDRVKFSELASEDWFKPVNDLTSKINKRQKNIRLLLKLNEQVKLYKNELAKGYDSYEENRQILEKIKSTINFLDDEDAKEYYIDKKKNENVLDYIPDTTTIEKNVKRLEKESTFTYNLLKNIDISPEEIQRAYCKKWTKNICKEDDTPLELMRKMGYYIVNNVGNNIHRSLFSSVLSDDKVNSDKKETNSVKPSIFNRLPTYVPGPYTYVPGYKIHINGIATVKTIYGAIFGFDEKWLDNILGILDPIVDTVFDEIKNSDLDFTTLVLSSMSGKTEEEIYTFFAQYKNIEKLKNKFNEFLKRNADSFSNEYKTTHFIGFSEEFQKKIKNAATETMKVEIETEYHNMEERVAQKILTIGDGLSQFREELFLFINSDDNFDNFDNLLENNKKPIDVLEKEARLKLKIQ